YGLFYQTNNEDSTTHLVAYSDSDFAGDKCDRKSTFGYLTYTDGNLVSWCSKKQSVVSLSTAEAEYVALSETIKEALYIKKILKSSGIDASLCKALCDKQTAALIAKEPNGTKLKHMEYRYHFIRDHIIKRSVYINYVKSA